MSLRMELASRKSKGLASGTFSLHPPITGKKREADDEAL